MTSRRPGQDDPRVQAALAELRGLIQETYPDATFDVYDGEDPTGVYLEAMVDVEDLGDVMDLFVDRMVDLQVDEGLPIYVIPVRPPERVAAMLRDVPPVRRPRLNIEDVLAAPLDQSRPSVRRAASGG